MSELTKQLGLLAGVIVVLALILTLFGAWPSSQTSTSPTSARSAPPPLTQSEAAQLQQMPIFQYLVSYTGKGFQPSTVTVKKGDTVRFTNNSSSKLWVASVGAGADQIYPGTSSCGSSAFDSCVTLNSGDFWQFTFTEQGTWSYQNNLDKNETGTVTVE